MGFAVTHIQLEAAMNCPYLLVPVIATCFASEKPYVPDSVELQECCKSKHYEQCPFFRVSMSRSHEMTSRVREKLIHAV